LVIVAKHAQLLMFTKCNAHAVTLPALQLAE